MYIPEGIWIDDVTSGTEAPEITFARKNNTKILCSIRFLGGIAFKYTSRYTDDLEKAAAETLELRNCVNVITTSGSGTGMSITRKIACYEESSRE